MCGRFTLTVIEDLEPFFELDERPDLVPRYNIAPSQEIAVVRESREGRRTLSLMRWGLTPGPGAVARSNLTINARAETVERKPMFRESFRSRRCLVPADGFYEWKKTPSGKQPFHIRLAKRGLFAMAGLWETQGEPSETSRPACAIVTTDANAVVAPIHDRMPVILPPESFALWLDRETPDPVLKSLCRPLPPQVLEAVEVGRFVNSAFNDSPRCLEPPDASAMLRQKRLF